MDNFKTIYAILHILEKSLDGGLDSRDLSPEMLGVSGKRRDALLEMLQSDGYISGLKPVAALGGRCYRLDEVKITIKGLEYIENNTMMQKAYRAVKGIADLIP